MRPASLAFVLISANDGISSSLFLVSSFWFRVVLLYFSRAERVDRVDCERILFYFNAEKAEQQRRRVFLLSASLRLCASALKNDSYSQLSPFVSFAFYAANS